MAINLFQFDWIFIDIVVIVLLILFLICVKMFKERFRWRSTVSNNNLYQYKFDKNYLELETHNNLLKNVIITGNSILKNKKILKPIIILIRNSKKRRLMQVLSEGLASYGFYVINIQLKTKAIQKPNHLDINNQKESVHLISAIIDFFKKRQLISHSHYVILTFKLSDIEYNSIIFDKNNCGLISINPKYDILTQKIFSHYIENNGLKEKTNFIFSKKSKLNSQYKFIKQISKNFSDYGHDNSNFIILENCKRSFKCCETILLGIIINLLESTNSKK